MTGAVQESRRIARRTEMAQRRWHDLRDVRHPLQPTLRVEAVLLRPSGVHVVTSAPSPPARRGTDPSFVVAGKAAADLVAAVLPLRYRPHVRAVICASADDDPVAENVDGVLVTTPSTLEHVLRASPVVLSTSELNEIALRLEARFEPFPLPAPAVPDGRRRRRLLTGLAAAASSLGAVAFVHGTGVVTPPW